MDKYLDNEGLKVLTTWYKEYIDGLVPKEPEPTYNYRISSDKLESVISNNNIDSIGFDSYYEGLEQYVPKDQWIDISESLDQSVYAVIIENTLAVIPRSLDNKIIFPENSSNFFGSSVYNSIQSFSINEDSCDVSNVVYMNSMFCGLTNCSELMLNGFDTSNVVYMDYMFSNCGKYSESTLTLHLGDLFTVGKVQSMIYMFLFCNISSIDMCAFDDVQYDVNAFSMFSGCSNLETIFSGHSASFNVDPSNSSNMFLDCTSIVGGSGTTYDSTHIDSEYARVDGFGGPGYFTLQFFTQS